MESKLNLMGYLSLSLSFGWVLTAKAFTFSLARNRNSNMLLVGCLGLGFFVVSLVLVRGRKRHRKWIFIIRRVSMANG